MYIIKFDFQYFQPVLSFRMTLVFVHHLVLDLHLTIDLCSSLEVTEFFELLGDYIVAVVEVFFLHSHIV